MALVLAATLTACSSLPRPTPTATPTAPAFNVNGRLLASDGERRFSASLRWSHGETSRILLTTPLGQALASIDIDAGGARITNANGQRYQAGSLDELVRRGLGLTLPIQQMPWWISGQRAPDVAERVNAHVHAGADAATDGATPADGLEASVAAGFRQGGWTVRYGARDDRGRPLRLDAQCNADCGGSQSGALSLRLIIDQWLEP